MTTVKPDLVEWFHYRDEARDTFWPREVEPILARWQAQAGQRRAPLIRCTVVDPDWLVLEGWYWPTEAVNCAPPPTAADAPVGFV